MKQQLIITFLLSIVCVLANADTQFFCQESNQYVNLGDSIATVKAECGAPSASSIEPYRMEKTRKVNQWIYNYQPNSVIRFGKINAKKGSLTINFINNKIVQIFVHGKAVSSTHFCSENMAIHLGDTNLTVYQLCNNPTIRQQKKEILSSTKVEKVTWRYQTNEYIKPTTMIFIDGKLTSIN